MITNAFNSLFALGVVLLSHADAVDPPQVPPATQETLTELIATIHGDNEPDKKDLAIGRLCYFDWPSDLVPRIVQTLEFVLEDKPASSIAHHLHSFALRHPTLAAPLVPKIADSLRTGATGG